MPVTNTSIEAGETQANWTLTTDLSDPLTVGDRIEFTKPITKDDVRAFAQLSGDTNELHLDAEAAEESLFGEQISHGILVAGLISAALARLPGTVIYLNQNLEFHKPAYPGNEFTAACVIEEDLGENKYKVSTAVTDGDIGIIDGSATILIED